MVIDLRSGATMADEERFVREIGPSEGVTLSEAMVVLQHCDKLLGPYWTRMAVWELGCCSDKRHVRMTLPNLLDLVAGCSLGDFDFNSGMVVAVFRDQFIQEAAGDQGVDTDAQTSSLPRRRHAGRLHGMVQLIDARSYALDKAATGLGQPNAPSL